jgi:hypothetical protein
MHWQRLQERLGFQGWSAEMDVALKDAYQKKKAGMWTSLATEMGFQGNWRVLEAKAFELGKKGLK